MADLCVVYETVKHEEDTGSCSIWSRILLFVYSPVYLDISKQSAWMRIATKQFQSACKLI